MQPARGAHRLGPRLHGKTSTARPSAKDGRSSLWARIPELLEPSAATLAILGDYVPFGIGQALSQPAGGNSLDNTLRIGRLVPTEWILIDVRIETIAHGFGHGHVYLWSHGGSAPSWPRPASPPSSATGKDP